MTTPLTSKTADHSDVLASDVPMQVQIYRQLKAEIVDGLWVDRANFPGEKELAERFGVSVITSRGALERLTREGLVDRGRGRRGRAIFFPPEEEPLGADFYPLLASRSSAKYRLVTSGVDIAPASACRAFGRPPGSQLWQAVRTLSPRNRDDVLAVTHNVQLPEVGERHQNRDLNSKPMAVILHSEGIDIAKVRRRIQASTPPPVVAHHLGLHLDSPALMILLQLEDRNGNVIEWMRSFSHPDRPLNEEVLDTTTGAWTSS